MATTGWPAERERGPRSTDRRIERGGGEGLTADDGPEGPGPGAPTSAPLSARGGPEAITPRPRAGRARYPLETRVATAAEAALKERGYVTAIDILLGLGWLDPERLEAWRRGQVSDLERVTHANLHKISSAMHLFRAWARRRGLRPSESVYRTRGGHRRPLRFSRSGDERIEAAYRTHFVSPALTAAKRAREKAAAPTQSD